MTRNEVTVRMRQEAALHVSVEIDKEVRKASCYGQKNVAGFDETMAYTAIAHALATWWSGCSEDEMRARLRNLAAATIGAWNDKQAASSTSTLNETQH